jgi:hypothetical protein
MTGKKALELLERNVSNCEFTPQIIRTVAKSLAKRGGPEAPSVIQGLLGHNFEPVYKAKAVAD